METPVCRRCLLESLNARKLKKIVEDYIESLDGEMRAPDHIYQQRLSVCMECGNLQNSMCALCGCFVEIRAAKMALSCPDTPPKWLGITAQW